MIDLGQKMLDEAAALRETEAPSDFDQATALEMSVAEENREAIEAEADGDAPAWLRAQGFHLAAAQIDAVGWPT